MKKSILLFVAFLFLFPLVNTTFAGIPGATDKVRAASLIVPFFEAGVDPATNPQDTILVVTSTSAATRIIHYHVWNIDGEASLLNANITLDPRETWSATLGNLIASASASTKTLLTDGTSGFYRGFVTIDIVTAATDLDPTETGYPFSNVNLIEGYIYYARILQGSATGLDMIPIEYVGSSVNSKLRDFYQSNDGREEIDSDARKCAETLVDGGTCPNDDFINDIDSRVYLAPSFNAASRIIIFTWDPGSTEGPSVFCDGSTSCDSTYTYTRRDEDGVARETKQIRLDHAVNVMAVSGTRNGWVRIEDIPSALGANGFQVFAFSFNSATSASISTNYDAIFPSYIIP